MKTFLIALEDAAETFVVQAEDAASAIQSVRDTYEEDVEGYGLFAVDLSLATTVPTSPGNLNPQFFE